MLQKLCQFFPPGFCLFLYSLLACREAAGCNRFNMSRHVKYGPSEALNFCDGCTSSVFALPRMLPFLCRLGPVDEFSHIQINYNNTNSQAQQTTILTDSSTLHRAGNIVGMSVRSDRAPQTANRANVKMSNFLKRLPQAPPPAQPNTANAATVVRLLCK